MSKWADANRTIKESNMKRVVIVIAIGVLLLLFTPSPVRASGVCGSGSWQAGNLEIHHINIGQGDSTLIVGPTGKSLLFDAGETTWNSSAKAQIIGPYIVGVLGCTHLDHVVISHFHLDHMGYVGYGGLWHLVEVQGFTVGKTLVRNYNTHLGNVSDTFTHWKTYLEGVGQSKLNPVWAVEGSSQVDLGPGVSFNIVTVNGNGALLAGNFSGDTHPPSENDYSIGAVLSYGDFDEWLGGDLDGQLDVSSFGYTYHDIELSVAPEVGDVDVYRANHQGSSHSTSATFINQLDPEVSIVSVGNGNSYGHPAPSTMQRLLATSTVYLTERGDLNTDIGSAIVAGNIVIRTSDGSIYTVNGTPYLATEPTRIDADGDGYFAEVDPDDGSSSMVPAPNGGCGSTYQTCAPATTSCQVTAGQIVINELFPSPASNGIEWLELYNTTGSPIDIGNCIVDDIPGGSPPYRIPASTVIPPHGFWTVDQIGYFNNSGDTARFLKEDGITVLDSFTYGSTGTNLAWYRDPDGGPWASSPTSSPTKGQSNNPSIVPTLFADVPTTYWAHDFIEQLYNAGITGGCSTNPLQYCPEWTVTRDQMAVFLLRGIHGSSYNPPPVGASTGFADVPADHWAAAWIKQLAVEGITGGCGGGNFCPGGAVTRDQMAVFLLKAKYGRSYTPPPLGSSTGFTDVPSEHWAAAWIKQLAAEGITGGCGTGLYCPGQPVNRAQMAVFLVKTFGLP
jgi:beta-lactamase superfamily II metal-dependent hydrolase